MMKRFIRKLIFKERADSQSYVAFLRKKGVRVGENVRFFAPTQCVIDTSCPTLLSIGNNVNITHGVIILTHDYSWSVMKQLSDNPGEIIGSQSPVRIGNNVFIGMNAIITCGVTVGDNVVIGAGSIVTRDCEPNSVYAGNPARRIMSIEEFREKRRAKQWEEAREIVLSYLHQFGGMPPRSHLSEYLMLFCSAEEAKAVPAFRRQMETGGNFDECEAFMQHHKPMFESYEAFLDACIYEKKEPIC